MKTIKELLADTEYEVVRGSVDTEVSDLIIDSRIVKEGCAFFCFVGALADGHDFIPQVVEKGASVIILQNDVDFEAMGITEEALKELTILKTPDTRVALGAASSIYFDRPEDELLTVALTGTKGKTSTASIIASVLGKAGHKVGIIGTIGADVGGELIKTKTTTPESYEVERLMRKMVENGCDTCVMEVSSQALKMNRVSQIVFDHAVFTNLTPDHIGGAEHIDMAEYIHCKSLLFKQCIHGHFNADDEHCPEMTAGAVCDIKTFSIDEQSDLKAENVIHLRENAFLGMSFDIKGSEKKYKVSAPGRYSVYNVLGAMSVTRALGIDDDTAREALLEVHVRGRMEPVAVSPDFTVLIDYAHNAVAMESILKAMRRYEPRRIISLFGCGGNRSRLRRYEMGEMSGRYADLSIITEDNSRMEAVEDIISDIVTGIEKTDGEYIIIPDRKEAIKHSFEIAEKGDVILLLGKGHEDYQDKGGKKTPFDERVIIQEILKEAGK